MKGQLEKAKIELPPGVGATLMVVSEAHLFNWT